jgi:hypothetical protein
MRNLRQSHVFVVTWRFLKIIVSKHNRDSSLELQQNAQMRISIVTEETVHRVALTRVDGIECVRC